MPEPKPAKRSTKESKMKKDKPARLRIRSDSEINRLSGISDLQKENEGSSIMKLPAATSTMTSSEVKKIKATVDPVNLEIEKPTAVNEDKVPTRKPTIQFNDIDYMIKPKVQDADYWKRIADECREALSKALEDNELLSDEVDLLKAENDQLRQIIEQVVAQEAIIP